MILKKFKTITPTRRFLFYYQIIIYSRLQKSILRSNMSNVNKKKTTNKQLKSTHVKSAKKYPLVINRYSLVLDPASVLIKIFKSPNKIKTISQFKSIYNTTFNTFMLNYHYVGFKLNRFDFSLNQPIILYSVPYYSLVCLISSFFRNCKYYCRSSGSVAIRLVSDKKQKMITIELPSKKKKLFNSETIVCIGSVFNTNQQLRWFGKYSNKNNKKLYVRGVAMNPVDHPNGGRTKSKPLEKSPWGWVAKHNK